jgi:hypothetical protein
MRWRPGFGRAGALPADRPGPDWQRLSDGRPWRLKRGRDFETTPHQFVEELPAVAAGLGKVVRAVVDKTAPDRYVWVQFAEASLDPARGCRCGGTTFRWLHPHFVRCESCGAQLLFASSTSAVHLDDDEDEDDDVEPLQPATASLTRADAVRARLRGRTQLDLYTDVHLDRYHSGKKSDRYAGYARSADGELVLLVVTTPLVDGEPVIDADSPIGLAHEVIAVPAAPFESGLDIGTLDDRVWDIVLP